MKSIQFALGPILYFWEKQRVFDFYETLSDSSFDIVYLGETVCSKRRQMRTGEWIELAKFLSQQGKSIVLSSLTLIEAQSELKTLQRLCNNEDFTVEANDMAAVELLEEKKAPFILGPAINIYSVQALKLFASMSMLRWVPPVELDFASLQTIKTALPEVSIEVFGYGHLPLAYSARCFTAREEQRMKDDCQFCCLNYPKGIPIYEQNKTNVECREDGSQQPPLFIMNGIQTLSGKKSNLVPFLNDIYQVADVIRISPELEDMEKVLDRFKHPSDKRINEQIFCNGYWQGKAGMLLSSGE